MRTSFLSVIALGTCFPSLVGAQEVTWGNVEAQDTSHSSSSGGSDRSISAADSDDLAVVGVANTRPICDAEDGVGCSVGVGVLAAFEVDELVTAPTSPPFLGDNPHEVTAVEIGEMMCDNLDKAETADKLKFALAGDKVVTAVKKSYSTFSGDAFSDNTARKVWMGEAEENADYDGLPRTVSMTWSGCDIQTFLMKVVTPSTLGGTFVTMSFPCDSDSDSYTLCVLEIHREETDESDESLSSLVDGGLEHRRSLRELTESGPRTSARSLQRGRVSQRESDRLARARLANVVEEGLATARLQDPDIDAKDRDIGLLQEYREASLQEKEYFHERGVRRLGEGHVAMPGGRVLEETTTIDLMVLYTKKAMLDSTSDQGTVRTNAQMETEIITAYNTANNALVDSGVDFQIRVVHIAEVAYTEGDVISEAVYDLYEGDHPDLQIHDLRDQYGADLVQLIGFYSNTCGIGFTMPTPSAGFAKYGYSVVHTNCLSNFSHTHELGHNLGANHDQDNSGTVHEYAYGWRYCSGTNPYRTIMAYSTDCKLAPRVNIFSSPDRTYAGRAQGTSSADNARVLSEAMDERHCTDPSTLRTAGHYNSSSDSEADTNANASTHAGAKSGAYTVADSTAYAPRACSHAPTPPPVTKQRLEELTPEPSSPSPSWQQPTGQQPTTHYVFPATEAPVAVTPGLTTPAPEAPQTLHSIYPEKLSDKRMRRKGCYRDDVNDRVMRAGTEMPAIPGVTIGMLRGNCMAYCYNNNEYHKYFGVEWGKECFCWWNNKNWERLGVLSDEECNIPCEGASSATCGGVNALEVFKIKDLAHDENPSVSSLRYDSYYGCYRHAVLGRGINNIPEFNYAGTSQATCQTHCKAAGYQYFALEFGHRCSCGNSPPSPSLEVDDERCDTPCSSPQANSTCGGRWHVAVYEVGDDMITDDDDGASPSDVLGWAEAAAMADARASSANTDDYTG